MDTLDEFASLAQAADKFCDQSSLGPGAAVEGEGGRRRGDPCPRLVSASDPRGDRTDLCASRIRTRHEVLSRKAILAIAICKRLAPPNNTRRLCALAAEWRWWSLAAAEIAHTPSLDQNFVRKSRADLNSPRGTLRGRPIIRLL
jgi:hypothetical protein